MKFDYISKFGEYPDTSVVFGRYRDDFSISMELIAQDGEPLTKATICMSPHGLKPDVDAFQVFIKCYGENEGIVGTLEDANIIKSPGEYKDVGFVENGCAICLLTDDAIAECKRQLEEKGLLDLARPQ